MQYQTYTHPGQPQMQVEVILASRHAYMPDEKPLYTIRMRYPRIIHGEVMTHRVFSRNARSSRAVPVRTMLLECTSMPFIPWHWGKNQSGMQASDECNELVLIDWDHEVDDETRVTREEAWLDARDSAVRIASAFMDAGYHKQNVNRLLEPFSWIDVLITANDWDNFLWLREHEAAEPHLQDLARLVKQAIDEAEVQELQPGEWHQPYIVENDRDSVCFDQGFNNYPSEETNTWLNKISSARCARISYKPFDGDASYVKEIERYDGLVSSDRVHASPTEHQATPDTWQPVSMEFEDGSDLIDAQHWDNSHLHGNLKGWIQFRKTIPGEHHSDSAMQERS